MAVTVPTTQDAWPVYDDIKLIAAEDAMSPEGHRAFGRLLLDWQRLRDLERQLPHFTDGPALYVEARAFWRSDDPRSATEGFPISALHIGRRPLGPLEHHVEFEDHSSDRIPYYTQARIPTGVSVYSSREALELAEGVA